MRYYLDTEFIEDGYTIDLISIGIVSEDSREYYAESCDFNPYNANDCVQQNVFPHLSICPYTAKPMTALQVAVGDHSRIGKCTPEFHLGQLGNYIAEQIQAGKYQDCPWRTREQIKDEILAFMDVEKHGTPEIWTYYGSYDHVALAQLFGEMIKLPQGWPMLSYDIEQFRFHVCSPKLPEQGKDEHNALADAKWNKLAYDFLATRAQELNDHVARVLSNNKPAENFTQGVSEQIFNQEMYGEWRNR